MYLADTFIQSDLQYIQVIHFFCQYVFPGNWTHNLCAANANLNRWVTRTLDILRNLPPPPIQLKHEPWLSSSKKDKKHHRSSPYVSCTIFQFFWNCTMAFYTEQTQMSVEIHWYLPFLHLNLIRVCIFTHAVTRCATASSSTQQNLHEFEGFITRCSGILHSD